jgi:hypothetical protein
MFRTSLHLAALKADYTSVDLLLSCGANVNCRDIDNNTPLHFASRLGSERIVEYLLFKRADYTLKNSYGETALDIVGNIHVYKVFLLILGEEKVKLCRNSYTRKISFNKVYHNNRCDNIKYLLFKDSQISKILLASMTSLKFRKFLDDDFPENVDLESFKVLESLGKGSFGEVYLVQLLSNNKFYAMKVLCKSKILSQNIVRYVVTERNVLSNIHHPYVVQLYYAFQTSEFLYLILEYCEGKDLCYHLRKQKSFDEDTVRTIVAQLILAIEELHKNNIIYR